jgi:hypothetical protein
MANDPNTNLFVVTKGNGFLVLKGFLKHDHFTYKPTQFTSLINKNILEYKYSKQLKEKKPKQNNLHFTLF